MGKRKASSSAAAGPIDTSELGPAFNPGSATMGATPDAGAAEAPPTSAPLTMYTPEGKPVDVDPATATDLYQSKKLGFAEGQKVNLRDKSGRIFEATPEQALQAFGSGMQTASAEEVGAAKERGEYNTLGKTAKAFGAGAARGLTFGLSDMAAAKLGGNETREELEKLKNYHPIASTAGEVTGALAPVIASGGLGAGVEGAEGLNAAAHGAEALGAAGEAAHVAQGAGLASKTIGAVGIMPRAVAGLGSMVERGASKLVGEGATGLLGRVAQRAVPLAAQGAAEGAVYGMGGEISEAALGDHELTAEKLLAGAKHGAMLGGAGGAILGSAEIVGREGLEKALKLGGEDGLQSWLEDFANQRTIKAAGGTKADIQHMGNTAEQQAARVKEIGETIRNYRLKDGEKIFHATSSAPDLREGLAKALDEQGARLDETRREISKIIAEKPELAPDVKGMLGRVDNEVLDKLKTSLIGDPGKISKVERALAPLRARMEPAGLTEDHQLYKVWQEAQSGNEQAARMLEIAKTKDPGLGKLLETKPPTIDEMTAARKHLDDIIYPKSAGKGIPPLPPEHQAQLIQVRRIMEDTIQEASERAAREAVRPDLYSDLIDAKRTIRNLIPAKEMADKSVAAVGNRWASASDTGIGGAVLAGTLAGGHGGPVGMLAGAASALGHKLVRERGSAVAAALADKLSQLARVRSATIAVDERISKGVSSALGIDSAHEAGEAAEVIAKAHDTASHVGRAAYEEHQRKMEEVASPIEHMSRVASMVAPIATHAPQTAAMVSQRAQQTLANIQSKMPKPPTREGSLQPNLDKPRIPASDQAKAERYARAAHDPLSILTDIKHNRLSYDAVDAVRDNSPKLLEQIKTTIVRHISEAKKPIPYEKRIQLGKLFGAPTDPTLEPAFVTAIRAVYADGGKGPQGNAPNGARRPMKTTAAQALTPSQELAQGAA